MTRHVDVAVIGAGIVGLSYAWAAAKQGQSVVIFERDRQAVGASIRNFGMIWPVGQSAGHMHEVALASRTRWCELAEAAGFWISKCGSIHLARREDELAVLDEFDKQADQLGFACQLLSAHEVVAKSPAAKFDGLLGGLWSPTELCVDPREAIRAIPLWLSETYRVELRYETPVTRIEGSELETFDKQRWRADRILIANGTDFTTLFPEHFATSQMVLCKLQMLRTRPQPKGFRIGPHLAGGLTLRHYANFAVCPSLDRLKQRIARESPELDRYGIHVMAAQNNFGEVVLGDSHQYTDDFDPFCKQEIDELILSELHQLIRLSDWTIADRWYGVYAKHPTRPYVEINPQPSVKIVTGLGGAGMTLSLGLAEEIWEHWFA